jgi:hypothetical protein
LFLVEVTVSRILLLLLLCSLSGLSYAAWKAVTVGSAGYWGFVPSLALDGAGYPHIAYVGSNGLTHAWNNGSVWSTEPVYSPPYGGPSGIDLAVDDQNLCRISFQTSGVLYYAVQTVPGKWSIGMANPPTFGLWTSIALDGDSAPFIACCAPDSLVLLHWTASQWQLDTVLAGLTSGMETDGVSLALDSADSPHLAFCLSAPSFAVMYASRIDGTWTLDTVEDLTACEPRGTSLVLDSQDHPHISYHTQTALRYASWDGASWQIETIDAVDTGMQEFGTSLALDAYGHPHIAHVSADGSSLRYSLNDGSGWVTETVCTIPGDHGGDPSLVLDNLGRPRIAFYRGMYMGLGYAWNDDPTAILSASTPIGTLELQVSPSPFTNSLSIRYAAPNPQATEVRIYDASGRLEATLGTSTGTPGTRTLFWQPDPALSNGVYFVVLTAGEARITESCLLLR